MDNQDNASQFRIAEYQATRNEMVQITTARYVVLAFTITAIAAILVFVLKLCIEQAVLIGPIGITTVLFPSAVMNLMLSRQFHRLSTFNAVFGGPVQQQAWEIYARKNPGFWSYVKPLAFAYGCLLLGTTALLIIVFWSWQIFIATLFLVVINAWPILRLWNASITGKWRLNELKLWQDIKEELNKSNEIKPLND